MYIVYFNYTFRNKSGAFNTAQEAWAWISELVRQGLNEVWIERDGSRVA